MWFSFPGRGPRLYNPQSQCLSVSVPFHNSCFRDKLCFEELKGTRIQLPCTISTEKSNCGVFRNCKWTGRTSFSLCVCTQTKTMGRKFLQPCRTQHKISLSDTTPICYLWVLGGLSSRICPLFQCPVSPQSWHQPSARNLPLAHISTSVRTFSSWPGLHLRQGIPPLSLRMMAALLSPMVKNVCVFKTTFSLSVCLIYQLSFYGWFFLTQLISLKKKKKTWLLLNKKKTKRIIYRIKRDFSTYLPNFRSAQNQQPDDQPSPLLIAAFYHTEGYKVPGCYPKGQGNSTGRSKYTVSFAYFLVADQIR